MANKSITVDWDNPSDLKRHISFLQMRRKKVLRDLGYVGVDFNGSKYTMDHVMPVFDKIAGAAIDHLYVGMDESPNYYVYVHCDPTEQLNINNVKHLWLATSFRLTHVPVYVGKGTGNRLAELNRNDSHRKVRSKLVSLGKDLVPVKLMDGLTEASALSWESKLIDVLGIQCLSKHGMLLNLDEGCLPCERRGCYPSDEWVKKLLEKNGFKMRRSGTGRRASL